MAIRKTEAVVLKAREFRDTSLISTLYTRDFGKIQGLAKGIRSRESKLHSRLQPLSHNKIVFYQKRHSDLHIVTQCDLINSFGPLHKNLERMAQAFYLLELVDLSIHGEEPSVELFELLIDGLKTLCVEKTTEQIVRIFEIKLLSILGFMPQFKVCVHCGSDKLEQARFSPVLGGTLCRRCLGRDPEAASLSKGAIASMIHVEQQNWEGIKRFRLTVKVGQELEEPLREFIKAHLGEGLKTLTFLEKINKMSTSLSEPEISGEAK